MASTVSLAIESALRDTGLFGARLVVGVSGGPDSLALLIGTLDVRDALKLDIVVAHFDHHLRPASGEDAAFVEALCQRYDVPFALGHGELVGSDGEGPSGVEERSRISRYGFFSDVVDRTGSMAVLVGHTALDQTETRLLHIARGSGLRGLRGMTPDSQVKLPSGAAVRVIRPLLSCTRDDTVQFCRARGQEPRIDPTNADVTYARNRLRQEIVPALLIVNPGIDAALSRLARTATDADDFIEAELDRRLPDLITRTSDSTEIGRGPWRALPRALKRALVRRIAASLHPGSDIGADAVEKVLNAIDSAPTGSQLTLADAQILRIHHDRAIFETAGRSRGRLSQSTICLTDESITPIDPIPGFDRLAGPNRRGSESGQLGLRIRHRSTACDRRRGDKWHVDVDRAKLGDSTTVLVRSRKNGDFLFPEGLDGRKKVQDLLVDAKIPREDRDSIPILTTADGRIVWVLGLRRDRSLMADDSSTGVLCLDVLEVEKGESAIVAHA